MYCHKCGKKTSEEVCKNCGTKIVKEDSIIIEPWKNEINFKKIIRHPEILDLMAEYSGKSKNKLSGEELLNKFDLVFGTVTGLSLGFLSEILVPIYSRLGIKTGKSDSIKLNKSIQEVFVKTMCALVKNNHTVEEFRKAKDGLILIGKIKPDLRSFGGRVLIELRDNTDFIDAKIRTVTKGQLYDWGKSKKIVKTLLKDIKEIELKNKPQDVKK